MPQHTYRITEIVGTSPESIDAAIRNGVTRAAQTLHDLDWFEATEIRGHIVEGGVDHFQVTIKVGFRVNDDTNCYSALLRIRSAVTTTSAGAERDVEFAGQGHASSPRSVPPPVSGSLYVPWLQAP